jgi:hypothetical protein
MKCVKCKFKDKKTELCTYPFKATAAVDIKFGKDGNIVGCHTGKRNKISMVTHQHIYQTPSAIFTGNQAHDYFYNIFNIKNAGEGI